ncbi:SOS response-associated peptidase [Ilyomonas limi]|uniref:Abasic site processing protein n=1 Tax=Ilyomonas limi TaxID=2575867 RepID=A0A4U3KRD7_9BACT|nr:SOS response-associated peptidase family protein [Ilyomonas limi]TKK64850.1 SOS response-associated peptidase [Ilyomonas limi]
MCYYNGQKVTREEFIRLKHLEKLVANYDFLNQPVQIGFDYNLNAILKRYPDKEDFDIVQMEWGFIPTGCKTVADVHKWRNGYYDSNNRFIAPVPTLNAQGEKLLYPGSMYEDAARYRRCLVLSTGFFESRHFYRKNKRTGQPVKTPDTYPYYITLKDREYFYMAGIWQPWIDQLTGEYRETFAIVTTNAVGHKLMEQVHNSKKRMPVILNEDLAYEWLFDNLEDRRLLQIAKTQYPSAGMQACTVAKNYKNALEPTKEHMYADLPALELTVNTGNLFSS